MKHRPLKQLCGLIATAAIALALVGCKGSDGPAGAAGANGVNGTNGINGTNGVNGTNGTNGVNGTNGTNGGLVLNAAAMTPEEWRALSIKSEITSVTAGSSTVVNFKVADKYDIPVVGLGFTTQTTPTSTTGTTYAVAPSLAHFAFTIAKLVPGTVDSPSHWVNYIVNGMPTKKVSDNSIVPATPGKPSTDNTGTLVDHQDGTYTYTFYRDITTMQAFLDAATYTGNNLKADLGDVTYQPNLTHRIALQISGNANGTGTVTPDASNSGVTGVPILNPANVIYDFIPATGAKVTGSDFQRQIVDIDACNRCHTKLAFHGGGARIDTQYCVICHTDQRKYGNAESVVTDTTVAPPSGTSTAKINGLAVGNFVNMIHQFHMGEELKKTGYNYAGVQFNEITYPQDQRNCGMCHTGAQGTQWKTVPSRLACGSCHDAVNFVTGANHGTVGMGGIQANDANCTICHNEASIAATHIPVVAPDATGYVPGSHTNGSSVAAYASNLPVGAHRVTWDLNSFSIDGAGHPVFKFRFLEDGVAKDFLTAASTTDTSFWTGYVGGPSFYLAMGTLQDGIAAPADWNTTSNATFVSIWNGSGASKGTLSAKGSDGYYTLTMTVVVPAGATMVTGGIGFSYGYGASQPLTQTAVSGYPYNTTTMVGGLSVPAPNVTKLATGWTGNTARRAIVTNAKCNDCHAALGVFTASVYHAGERNDAPTCTFCHNANRVNSGWGVNIKDAVHAIHSAKSSVRTTKYSWEAGAGLKYWDVTYPAILNNCEACHVAGSYDFSGSNNAKALPNLLWTTVATGTVPNPVNVVTTGTEAIPGSYWSPFVTAGAVYGSGFSANLTTGVVNQAAGTTLVNSPITSACSSCHDSNIAIAHMQANGGAFYEARTTAFTKTEQCMVCHGNGKTADIKVVHMNFK